MKLLEVLQLDLRIKENNKIFIGKLSDLPFFENIKVDTDSLEKAIHKIQRKYPVMLSYIMSSNIEDKYWTAVIKETEGHKLLKTIYGITLFETLGKTVLFLYAYIRKNFK